MPQSHVWHFLLWMDALQGISFELIIKKKQWTVVIEEVEQLKIIFKVTQIGFDRMNKVIYT